MYNNSQEVKNKSNEQENSSCPQEHLDIPPKLRTIPSQNPFLYIIENKTQEGHEMDKRSYDMKQQMDWRMPRLKKEKTQDETEPHFLSHDFSTQLNNFPGTFDVNAIPGLMPPTGHLNPNPFDLVPFKIPQTTRRTRSSDVLTPIDVRTLLSTGNSQGKLKTVAREPVDIRVPVDIRNMPSNQYNNLILASDPCSGSRGVGTRRNRKEKSLAGLPAKLQELGVSNRLSKLEKLIRMDESVMTEKQRKEKITLLRLEKNRRAAAISRERKKRYIRSLEERSLIMSKHLEALELENAQLRQLLSQNNIQKPNMLSPALPNMPNLKPSPFDEEGNTTHAESRKRPFPGMMDMNISGMSDATEGGGTKLTIKMNEVPLVQTTAARRGKKRMRLEGGGVESMDMW